MGRQVRAHPGRLEDYTDTVLSSVAMTRSGMAAYRSSLHAFRNAQPNSLGGPALSDHSAQLDDELQRLRLLDAAPAALAVALRGADAGSRVKKLWTRVGNWKKRYDAFRQMNRGFQYYRRERVKAGWQKRVGGRLLGHLKATAMAQASGRYPGAKAVSSVKGKNAQIRGFWARAHAWASNEKRPAWIQRRAAAAAQRARDLEKRMSAMRGGAVSVGSSAAQRARTRFGPAVSRAAGSRFADRVRNFGGGAGAWRARGRAFQSAVGGAVTRADAKAAQAGAKLQNLVKGLPRPTPPPWASALGRKIAAPSSRAVSWGYRKGAGAARVAGKVARPVAAAMDLHAAYKARHDSKREFVAKSSKATGSVLIAVAPLTGPAAPFVAGAGVVVWGAGAVMDNKKWSDRIAKVGKKSWPIAKAVASPGGAIKGGLKLGSRLVSKWRS